MNQSFNSGGRPGGLGDRIGALFLRVMSALAAIQPFKAVFDVVLPLGGFVERMPNNTLQKLTAVMVAMPAPSMRMLATLLSVLMGIPLTERGTRATDIIKVLVDDPEGFMKRLLVVLKENPPSEFAVQEAGAFFESVYLLPLTNIMERNKDNPQAAMREVLGLSAGITVSVQALGVVAEILGVGQIQSLAILLSRLVDALGIPQMTNEMIRPIMSKGFGEWSRRYFNRKYRPQRWSTSELMQLYALREIDYGVMREGMREEGYEDADIERAYRLSERRPSLNDILRGKSLNLLTDSDVADAMYKMGYSADAVRYLMAVNKEDERRDDLNSIASVAVSAYKKGLMSESQYRAIRTSAKIPQERIDIEVQIAQLSQQQEARELSVSNVKQAYQKSVISRLDADYYLTSLQLDGNARSVLLATWDEEMKPKVLRLNSTTITQAVRKGVLTLDQARAKLREVGWGDENIKILLEVSRLENVTIKRQPSASVYLSAYVDGLLTREQTTEKLIGLGFSGEDAELYLRMSAIRPARTERMLTKTDVVNLYEKGFMTFAEALAEMEQLGYASGVAELVIIANASTIKSPSDLQG